MIRMDRDPTMTRENTSRPSWSVPNQCAADGGELVASRLCASGLCGAIAEPKMAHTIQNSRMAAPAMNVGRRSSSRHGGISARPVCATATSAAGSGREVSHGRSRAAAAGSAGC